MHRVINVYHICIFFEFSSSLYQVCNLTLVINMKFGWLLTQAAFREHVFVWNLYLCVFICFHFLILRIFLCIFHCKFLSALTECWIYSSPADITDYKLLSFRKTSCSLLFFLLQYCLLKQLDIYVLQTRTKISIFGAEPVRKTDFLKTV